MNIQILQHSIGVDQYGQSEQFRNHFATGPESKDFVDCQALVQAGLMQDNGARKIYGGMHVFTVTALGVDYVDFNSPAAPKVSRSKQRYQAYLKSESDEKFGDWLKNPYWDDYRARCIT